MSKRFPLVLLLLLVVSSPRIALAAQVAGKLTLETRGIAGVRLFAWPLSTLTLSGEAPHRSAPTGEDGRYLLELPPGEYWLLAEGKDHYAFYGRNPVMVPPQGLTDINIGLLPRDLPLPDGKGAMVATGVYGRVSADGKGLEGATVYLYPDLTSQLKGMGLAMAVTGPEGLFEVEAPAGTYYLLVRHRRGQQVTGPLRAGDFVGYCAGNPLKVLEGKVLRVAVPAFQVPARVETRPESLFGTTSIRGRIIDKAGKPVAGVRALVYEDPKMLNRPLHLSQPTGADGLFILSLPHGGTWYLGARNTLGGAPAPGDLIGTFDGRPDHAVVVENGKELGGIDIVMEEMW